jgi:hypothetical protein
VTEEHLQDSLKLVLAQYSPAFTRRWMEYRPRRLTNEQGKPVLSMHVAFTINVSGVVLFLPILSLKVRYDDRRGW